MPNNQHNHRVLWELAKHVPALLVLSVIIFTNARSLSEERAAFMAHIDKRDEEFTELTTVISAECHAVTNAMGDRLMEVVESNTEALMENTRMLGRMER